MELIGVLLGSSAKGFSGPQGRSARSVKDHATPNTDMRGSSFSVADQQDLFSGSLL
jgi:hypothetical protein